MRVDGHGGREFLHFKFPNRFWCPKLLHEKHVVHSLNAFRQHLRRAANGVQINTTMFSASLECSFAHSAFANNRSQPEIANDLPLIRLFAN